MCGKAQAATSTCCCWPPLCAAFPAPSLRCVNRVRHFYPAFYVFECVHRNGADAAPSYTRGLRTDCRYSRKVRGSAWVMMRAGVVMAEEVVSARLAGTNRQCR